MTDSEIYYPWPGQTPQFRLNAMFIDENNHDFMMVNKKTIQELSELFGSATKEYSDKLFTHIDEVRYGGKVISEEQQQKNLEDFLNSEPFGGLDE